MYHMISYQEKKTGNRSDYIKLIINDSGEIVSQRSVSISVFVVHKDKEEYFLLYDEQMNVIHDAFTFLNIDRKDRPLTTRRSDATALRLLYSFLSLSNTSIYNIGDTQFHELVAFLRGITGQPNEYSLKTIRGADTVNHYLSIYRLFFTARGIKCAPLFATKTITTDVILGDDYATKVQRVAYKNNVKRPTELQKEVPMYVSPAQFQKLYSVILTAGDTTAQLITHLAYGYGLRLGEILGLTIEDIQERTESGNLTPILILRNRVSDQPFQYAKNLMHPTSISQYKKDIEYKKSRSIIHITYDLYDQLVSYVNEFHTKMMEKYPDNYKRGYADVVSVKDAPETNHYVFLNRYGNVLTDQTWNNALKKYYVNAGIVIDHGYKKCNLTHRLRHGFAMFKARFSEHPVDVLKLKELMRHRSIMSTMVYYTPTDDDIFQIKTEFQDDLYKMIPELKGGTNVQ
jgi:integrase